ncbi:thymidylate synthase [Microcoleus sp. AT3-D2]|uniref:thymidylate synthase n=1 Tax=Microcoleus sp. AT3-D2 TaxID=2818612 RepID=UPI002FD52102
MQKKYVPLYKPNQLILGTGQIAVVSGWIDKGAIAKKLEPEEFAVIGQLYSAISGINYIIRNLLYNPHVRHLVIVNATEEDNNSGAAKCLLHFFRHGFEPHKRNNAPDSDCWKIISKTVGYIDKEIPFENLQRLRESIECHEKISITEAVTLIKELAKKVEKTPEPEWATPITFPLIETVPTIFPGERYGHRIEGKTIAETWVKLVHRIKTTGVLRPTGYDGQWQELINVMAVVTNEPADFYFPQPNYLPMDRQYLEQYIPYILDDVPYYREGIKYTYGQRLRSWFGRDQIEQVIEKLIKEIDADSAVMNIWDSGCGNLFSRPDGASDHEFPGSPCLNHIWVRVVDEEILLTGTFRSNDIFGAWPANAMGLRALQQHIRDQLARRSKYDLKMGPLITISQSAHLYDNTWETVDQLIAEQYPQICRKKDYSDPAGTFLIELVNGQIEVQQQSPIGETVFRYSGSNPLQLATQICNASPAILPLHIAYLSIELQKASECLKANHHYIQDK